MVSTAVCEDESAGEKCAVDFRRLLLSVKV